MYGFSYLSFIFQVYMQSYVEDRYLVEKTSII